MGIKKNVIATMGVLFLSTITLPSYAGACKQVKFKFTNHASGKIKVRSIFIVGNDGSWTEDISNKQVDTNNIYTTNKRKLNKLDSGSTGTFKVKYDLWDSKNNKWQKNKNAPTKSAKCMDGKTIKFTIN